MTSGGSPRTARTAASAGASALPGFEVAIVLACVAFRMNRLVW